MTKKERKEFEKLKLENLAMKNSLDQISEHLVRMAIKKTDNKYPEFVGSVRAILEGVEDDKKKAIECGYALDYRPSAKNIIRKYFPDGRVQETIFIGD